MKLRNKKTGETINGGFVVCEYKDGARFSVKDNPCFDSLAELNEKWEDYKPTEPPIKDKKKRKLIRDWAEINGIKVVSVCETFNAWGVKNIAKGEPGDKEYMLADILFRGEKPEKLEFGKEYTIPELCGKEVE